MREFTTFTLEELEKRKEEIRDYMLRGYPDWVPDRVARAHPSIWATEKARHEQYRPIWREELKILVVMCHWACKQLEAK